MRAFLLLTTTAALLLLAPAWGQSTSSGPNGLKKIPVAAEPQNGVSYPAYTVPQNSYDHSSPLDIGPAQKPFALASQTDDLAESDHPPTANTLSTETVQLDPRIKVEKVHEVETDNNYQTGGNQALEFEIKYLNFGAVTSEQYDARKGHYFTISWSNQGPRDGLITHFQYREVLSRDIVRTLIQPVTESKKTNRSYFAVVGKAFRAYGPINAWRFTVYKGDTVIAQEASISW